MENKEIYKGDYKVDISDQGRVRFDLNYKWLIGIVTSILIFIGYLLLDRYYFVPMDSLKKENTELKEESKKLKGILEQVVQNQKILLDRSDRMEKWLYNDRNHNNQNDNDNDNLPKLPENVNTNH